jgi:hypothetical protein
VKLKITSIVLFLLLVASIYGLVVPGRSAAPASNNPTASGDSAPLVDQTPLLTPQALVQVTADKCCKYSIRTPF